jgi:hypothetical protein
VGLLEFSRIVPAASSSSSSAAAAAAATKDYQKQRKVKT